MNKKRSISAAVVLVMLAVVGTTAVIAQRADEPPPDLEVVDLDQIKEGVVREMFDSTGKMMNPDRQLAGVASDHEGGFGGFYFHETDKSIVYVYMQDVTKTAAAEAAFRAAYSGDRKITQIIPVQGDYSLDQLVEWFYILDRALLASDIIPMRGSVREIENRIYFGLEDADLFDDALQVMERLGIPEGAVIFDEDSIELLTDEDSVREKWRPLVGGIQHEECWVSAVLDSSGSERLG